MKNKLLILATILSFTMNAAATIHTVTVADYQFSPSIFTMNLGDTVVWTWVSGTHTTTNTAIPTSATTWNAPIGSSSTTFTYTPLVAGTYSYECSIHASMGMTGSFTVNNRTGIGQVKEPAIFTFYPNPANGVIHLMFIEPGTPVNITLIDENGNIIKQKRYTKINEVDFNTKSISDGTYTLKADQGKNSSRQLVIIKH